MGANQKKWEGENPWLGLQTYQEGNKLWGRDTEVSTLSDIICNNLATVVFGKSGIGKSSLIHAGISPELRKRGLMPIYIRLEHNSNTPYTDQIIKAVNKALNKEDKLDQNNPPLGLWDFFHRNVFYNEEHQETLPVVFIDQFEEIYTLADAEHKYQAQELFEEFADLLNNKKPEKVMAFENEATTFKKSNIDVGGDSVLTFRIHSERKNTYIEDSNFHVVICLREDYLYYLERNTSKIPSLKINRFSLQALDRQSASDVIIRPRPGLFSENEANEIITKISTFNDEGNEEIDPTILSIFLFKYYNRKGNLSTDNIISEFYADETKGISSASLAYLEDHLITGEGFRHFSPYNDALSSGVTEQELEKLISSRIITVETRKGHRYLEFSHDVICPIAKSNREQRKLDEQARKLRKRIFAATGLVFFALILIGIFLQQDYLLQVSKTKNASIRAHYMIVQGDVLDAIKLLLNVAPNSEGHFGSKILPETEKALNEAYDSLYSDYACIAILNHQNDVNTAEFSEDTKLIITACSDGICRIWNGQSGELQKELKSDVKDMTGASLSKDGNRVIASFGDGIAIIWDLNTGEIIDTLKNHASTVNYACFSPDGKYALTASKDNTVKLWNAQTGKFVETIVKHRDNVKCAMFSTNGKKIITASEDGSAIVFDLDTHVSETVFDDNNVSVEYAEYNYDDTKIAIVTNRVVYIIDVDTNERIELKGQHDDLITSATFSPDGKTIATSSHDKTIKLWDVHTGNVFHTYVGHSSIVKDVVFSSDGRFVLSTSNDNEARLWNFTSDDRPDIILCEMDILSMVTYSPDGKYIAAISVMGEAKIWDAESREMISTFSIPERANSIAFNEKSDKVVVTSELNKLRVFDVKSGVVLDSIEVAADSNYDNALFIEDDKAIVAYSSECSTVKWLLDKHTYEYMQGEMEGQLTCLSPLPNANIYLLSHYDKTSFSVWNMSNNTLVKEIGSHAETIWNIRCSHDGKQLISSSSDNTAFIWDMTSGSIIHKLKRHSSQVYSSEFSPNDHYVITSSIDETVKIWNVENGTEVITRKNLCCPKYGIMFRAKGREYITSPNGKDIRLYELMSPNEMVDKLKPRYNKVEFTNEEEDYYSL